MHPTVLRPSVRVRRQVAGTFRKIGHPTGKVATGTSSFLPICFGSAQRQSCYHDPNVSDPDSRERYWIGSFQLDAEQKVLSRDGEIVPLTPKAIEVLIVLARRQGDVASKEELFAAAWPDTWVDDSTLAKVIYTLRRDLGPLPDGRPLIENIPKRGYRLVVTPDSGNSPEDAAQTPEGEPAKPGRSHPWMLPALAVTALVLIAVAAIVTVRRGRETPSYRVDLLVMPFTAAGGEEEKAVARGIADFLSSRLAAVPGLSIVSPSLAGADGALHADEAAKRLGADVILTGIVSSTGDRIRVSYHLTSVDDRRLINAESLEATASDIFEMEERVASWIATNLELRRSLRRDSDRALSTPDRQRIYVLAIGCLRPNTPEPKVEQALALLQSLEPEGQHSARVQAAFARAYLDRFWTANDPKDLELAQRHVDLATSLDPDHPRARALRGAIHRARGEFDEAATELRAALALEPDAPDVLLELASLYNAMGRQSDAQATLDYLLAAHPRCATCVNRAGRFHSQNGRLEKAAGLYKRAIELAPDAPSFYGALAGVYIKLGRYDEAVPVLETAIGISPSAISSSNLGYCRYLTGDYEGAAIRFGDAIRLSPNTFLYRGNLGDALRLVPGRGDEADSAFDGAIELARASLEINPNDPLTRALLAEYLAKRGDTESANTEIAVALSEAAPDSADIYLSAAIVRMLEGEKQASITLLGRAIDAGLAPSIVDNDPQFQSLRSEVEFTRLLQRTP